MTKLVLRCAWLSIWVCGPLALSQPMFVGPPAGVRLEVSEKSIDLSRFAETELHLNLVNGSAATLILGEPGYAWLQGQGDIHGNSGCQLSSANGRVERIFTKLLPGQSYSMSLALRDVFCMGMNGATGMNALMQVRVQSADLNGDAQVGSVSMALHGELPDPLAIRFVLEEQQQWWNQGNLENFAKGYKDSPDILFIGSKVRRGYAQMLATYKANYPTPAKMGQLSFTDLEVQPLDARFATVTGRFALARTAEGGGNASGSFLLVMEKTGAGWKIVRDDTASDTPPKP